MTLCIFSYILNCGVFFSGLVDPTASVCFSVFNLCWAVNCPSNNLSDAATEGDPDYTTLHANAKSSCLMAAAQSFVLLWFTFKRHKSNSPLRQTHILPVFILNVFKSYCFSYMYISFTSWGHLASLACIYSQPSDTITKETHCDFQYFAYFCLCGSLLRIFSL